MTARHPVHLPVSLHTSFPRPPQSQSTLYSHQSTRIPVPYCSFLFVAGAWLCYFCTSFLQQCESHNVCLQSEMSYFYDLKSPTQLAYRTKFCGIPDGLSEPGRIGTKGIPGLKQRLYRRCQSMTAKSLFCISSRYISGIHHIRHSAAVQERGAVQTLLNLQRSFPKPTHSVPL